MRGLTLLLCVAAALTVHGEPSIYLGEEASSMERDAAHELQRHIYAVTGDVLPVTSTEAVLGGAEGFVLGTRDTLPRMAADWPFGLDEPEHDGYILRGVADGLVIVGAPSPEGVRNGVYGLLEELGFGFYLGGDAYPEPVRGFARLEIPSLEQSRSPAFAVRGALPWHTRFTGPVAWELEDYKAYIDQLARMRLNFVGFRIQDDQPFAAFEHDGELAAGEPLPNTSQSRWDTPAMETSAYLAGTGMYFAREHFGPESSFALGRAESIRQAQEDLRQAIRYARGRGMHVCVGFEVRGDALDPSVQERTESRLLALLDTYPEIDYVWIWQQEGLAAHRATVLPDYRSPWRSYTQHLQAALQPIAGDRRRAEAARVTLLAHQAREVVQAVRPDVGLAVSGWGGDEWLHFTDFFPALDETLPGDTAFSALDNVPIRDIISNGFEQLRPERERWPIIWWELQSDRWIPGAHLDTLATAVRDAADKNVQGLLGVHWRTRPIEENAGYAASLAWDLDLTPDEFMRRRAAHLFGEEHAEDMADILIELETIGAEWSSPHDGLPGGSFEWTPASPEMRERLIALRDTVEEMLPAETQYPAFVPEFLTDLTRRVLMQPMDWTRLTRVIWPLEFAAPREDALQDLYRELHFLISMDDAMQRLEVDGLLDAATETGDPEALAELLQESQLPDALHAYAQRIRSKGELGVLATLNAKLRERMGDHNGLDQASLDALTRIPDGYAIQPSLLVLPDQVIALGLEEPDLSIVMRYRKLGEEDYEQHTLPHWGQNSYRRTMPEGLERPANIEYGFEVQADGRTVLAWPEGFPDRVKTKSLFRAETAPPAAAPEYRPDDAEPNVTAAVDAERYAVDLSCEHPPGTHATVFRNGEELGSTYVGWWRDTEAQSEAEASYRVRFRPIAGGDAFTAETMLDIPRLPLPEPPEVVRAQTRGNRIILGWDSNSPAAAEYLIGKYDEDHSFIGEATVPADYGHYLNYADRVAGGDVHIYEVAAVAPDGRVGPSASRVGVRASTEPLQPRLRLSFRDEEEMLRGMAEVAESALALGGTGWAELPPQSAWDPGHSLSLSVWFKPERLDGMPVLICKGRWEEAGYFVQVFDRQVRFYMAGVDTLDAGRIEPGEWQHIVCTYGFGEMRIYINGELVGRNSVTGRPRPAETPLLLGRYESPEDVYFVHGYMDDIRIYDVALTGQEVREVYQDMPPE